MIRNQPWQEASAETMMLASFVRHTVEHPVFCLVRTENPAPPRQNARPCRIDFYQTRKGGMPVKRDGQPPVVHCFFTEEGEKLPELLLQSLRLFIERNLQNQPQI